MNCKKLYTVMLMLAVSMVAAAQYYTTYEVPYPVQYMPAHPDFQDTRFSIDIKQYFYGKTVQKENAVRAAQIRTDAYYGIDCLSGVMGPIIGFEIKSSVTPRLYTMYNYGITTAAYGSSKAKSYYHRKRPATIFNEAPYSHETLTEMVRSYSYPSSHSMTGWAVGILTAAVAPRMQDTLLFRAYDYGQSRVLGGMHWQSDVSDARIIASACVARMLCTDLFKSHLKSARNEYNKLQADSLSIAAPDYEAENYYDADHIANGVAYLPEPPAMDASSPEFAYDMDRYIWGKSVRDTELGIKAKFDVNTDFDVLMGEFSRAVGQRITAEYTPTLYSLLQKAVEISDNACKKAQEHYARQRPYDFFKEDAFTFENQSNLSSTGSYPSVHSARTWTTALLLVAMQPERQDTILKVGFDLGQSAVIAGVNWQSDVDAGRLTSSAALSRMLSNPNFMDLIQEAQNEFAAKSQTIVTDQEDITIDTDDSESDSPMYTIDGRVATPDSRGVIVGRKRKILK